MRNHGLTRTVLLLVGLSYPDAGRASDPVLADTPPLTGRVVTLEESLPVRVEGVGLWGALADAQRDIPIRASIERCSPSDGTRVSFDTVSTATPDATLAAALAGYTAAGGTTRFVRQADTRRDGVWVRLQEESCPLLDTPIDFDFVGDLGDALQPWADALAVATGQTITAGRGIRSGGGSRSMLETPPRARCSCRFSTRT